ncbi:MAG: NADH-quinone oxidoreductase subunit NuoE [Rhodospirillales bacterium]|jgi:NADH-quinone oxidoreductase E subunit|nr:NADH-quinone oxidoreductase subunit NuoE [Rhodospirillales bacterium]
MSDEVRMGDAADQPQAFVLSDENREKAQAMISLFPEGRQASAVLPILDLAQRQNDGWLPRVALDYVAELLGIPRIQVYEVATFYSMLNLAPVGRHHVQVCTNLSCWLRGSDDVLTACKNVLGIEPGETTDDGLFTLSEAECLGACVNAPMMQIGDDYYEDLDAGSAQAVLTALTEGKTPEPGPQNGRKGCEPAGKLTSLTDKPAKARRKKAPATPVEKGGA